MLKNVWNLIHSLQRPFAFPTSYFVKQYGGKVELWLEGQLHIKIKEEMLISWTPIELFSHHVCICFQAQVFVRASVFHFNSWSSIFWSSVWVLSHTFPQLKWLEEGEYILIKCSMHMKLLFIGRLLRPHTSKEVKQASCVNWPKPNSVFYTQPPGLNNLEPEVIYKSRKPREYKTVARVSQTLGMSCYTEGYMTAVSISTDLFDHSSIPAIVRQSQ